MYLNDCFIDEKALNSANVERWVQEKMPTADAFCRQCLHFMAHFLSPAPTITVQTSGSTGTPKALEVEKARMRASARMTGAYLGLKPGARALLCMPLEHIAGMMVVVRALELGLSLYTVTPCADPFAHAPSKLDFAAITPMQAHCVLQQERSRAVLATCRQIIVGGGFISADLNATLGKLPTQIYHSYGMTETLSHIALRRIDALKPQAPFYPLPHVRLSLDKDGALCIDAPAVAATAVQTNDLATINADGSFVILGRRDNVINSGGIKLIPELIEEKLSAVIKSPVAISARTSARYGEEVVLVSEVPLDAGVLQQAYATLGRYEKPKALIIAPIPRTATQKIDRLRLKQSLSG